MKSLTDAAMENPCPYLSQIKPWSGQGTFVDYLVNHYALMAMNKGTLNHSRFMVAQLQNLQGEWAGLSTLIAKRIKELRNEKTRNGGIT
jgi:hypothetical protein